ncbi:MAG: hypothetical protein HUU02_00740 [Bacteroidetes bacterium]|nr:hypothetical protein [Bacteroidota bacterium]
MNIIVTNPDGIIVTSLFSTTPRQSTVLLLLFVSISFLLVIIDRSPVHLEKRAPAVAITEQSLAFYEGTLSGSLGGPYAYRVLVPYGISVFHALLPFAPVLVIDGIIKFFLLILCQWGLYRYLCLFFPRSAALFGVLYADILISFTLSSIAGPSITETADILNMVFFIAAFYALHQRSLPLLLITLFVATWNRETILAILPMIIIDDIRRKERPIRSIAAMVVVLSAYVVIRLIIPASQGAWFTFTGLVKNIPFLSPEHTMNALMGNIHVALLLLPLIVLSLVGFRRKPVFLQNAMAIVPLFIVAHYLVGVIIETRLWMPLFIILIPLSLITILESLERPSSNTPS